MAYIEIRNMNLKFEDRTIFSGFNLEIEKNEKILFSAASGRGKTILIKMLLGFVIPEAGEIFIDGIKLSGGTVNSIRSKITYVSQYADIPKGVVGEVFAEVFQFRANRHLNYKVQSLMTWLEEFSLPPETIEKDVDSLTWVERQQLALIMWIILDRDIWILDETTTGLELAFTKKIVELLLNYNKTMIIVSNDDSYENRGFKEMTW